MVRVLAGLGPRALPRPTPCTEFTVADLLDHLSETAGTLTVAAVGGPGDGTEPAASEGRDDDVASRLAADVERLATAWADPGLAELETTTAGGISMPVSFHNMIAVQELVLHAWDLAEATGQDFHPDPGTLERLHGFLTDVAPRDGSGPFGPAIPVPDDASVLDQVLGMSGRVPWAQL